MLLIGAARAAKRQLFRVQLLLLYSDRSLRA
jgi:hypothetical protein